jgi:hypothetical protein
LLKKKWNRRKKSKTSKRTYTWDAKSPTVADPENELDLYVKAMADQHVFRSCGKLNVQLDQVKDAEGALRLALQFEKDSVMGREGPLGREFI